MKNMIKKNQMMITALAIMIAVAGYLNFAGTKVTDEEIMTVPSEIAAIRSIRAIGAGGSNPVGSFWIYRIAKTTA